MEAGNGATGNGDEQQRNHGGCSCWYVDVDHRRNHGGVGNQHGAIQGGQADKQLQAVDVVTGLQQHPHRQQGSDSGVNKQNDDPGGTG